MNNEVCWEQVSSPGTMAGPEERGGTEPAPHKGLRGEVWTLEERAAEGGGPYGVSY